MLILGLQLWTGSTKTNRFLEITGGFSLRDLRILIRNTGIGRGLIFLTGTGYRYSDVSAVKLDPLKIVSRLVHHPYHLFKCIEKHRPNFIPIFRYYEVDIPLWVLYFETPFLLTDVHFPGSGGVPKHNTSPRRYRYRCRNIENLTRIFC